MKPIFVRKDAQLEYARGLRIEKGISNGVKVFWLGFVELKGKLELRGVADG